MSADPQHARSSSHVPPCLQRPAHAAKAGAAPSTASSEGAVLNLAIDSGVPVDPLELVNAALQGRVRLDEVANSCRRGAPGPVRDVRVRKKPRIRPRP